jgi:hypothetical protein
MKQTALLRNKFSVFCHVPKTAKRRSVAAVRRRE